MKQSMKDVWIRGLDVPAKEIRLHIEEENRVVAMEAILPEGEVLLPRWHVEKVLNSRRHRKLA